MAEPPPTPPEEFLCPISRSLMADPVVLLTGHTCERACVDAYLELGFTRSPVLADGFDLSELGADNAVPAIPNFNLKKAIVAWCDRNGVPRPVAPTPLAARAILRALTSTPSSSEIPEEKVVSEVEVDAFVEKLLESEPADRESAMGCLRQLTRSSNAHRSKLCTPAIVAVILQAMSDSSALGVRIDAAASLHNLSLDPENKVNVFRWGGIPAVIALLTDRALELRDLAAGLIHSLAMEDKNRVPIGMLGAITPLVNIFAGDDDGVSTRRSAGLALYYLSLAEFNRSKLAAASGSTTKLVALLGCKELRGPALMVAANLSGDKTGREKLVDGGAIEKLTALMRAGEVAAGSIEEERCVAALNGMSKVGVRFRVVAKSAGVEAVLRQVAEGSTSAVSDENLRSLARKTLKAVVTSGGTGGKDYTDAYVEEYGSTRSVSEQAPSRPFPAKWNRTTGF